MAAVKTKEQIDVMFKELEPIVIPGPGLPLLPMFRTLSSRRSFNQSGPLPLSFQEIQAFNQLTQSALSPWQVEALCSMDGVFINTWTELQEQQRSDSV